jgi:hypothetical protein
MKIKTLLAMSVLLTGIAACDPPKSGDDPRGNPDRRTEKPADASPEASPATSPEAAPEAK